MGIPNRQIGWSQKVILLNYISQQLEKLNQVAGNVVLPAPPTPPTSDWTVVTGGAAGDGTVAQYATNGFNITGPDDDNDDGWVYIKQYFPNGAIITIDYQWASSDEGTGVDRPIFCIDDQEPTGIPSNTDPQVGSTPETGTWDITVNPGQWFSVGIYSTDSCCGRGFLSVDINIEVATSWTFVPGEISIFPTGPDGYTLYEGSWSNYDDGQTDETFPFAGDFYTSDGIVDNSAYMSTNGYVIPLNSGFQIYGNEGDLYLTPGDPLDDGDTQNFWYQNYVGANRWRTSMLVYCGRCCGSPNQQTPFSYILNIYRDGQYQYVEACAKTNTVGGAGPETNMEDSNTATQVWQSDLNGSTWTYLGFGNIQ